jgi:miniconductance mechanosensitive channel
MDTMKALNDITFGEKLKELLLRLNLSDKVSTYIVDFSVLIIIFLSSVIIYYILKFILNRILKKIIDKSVSKWDDYLYEEKVFTRLALLFPALVLQAFLNSVVTSHPHAIHMIDVVLKLYMISIVLLVITSFLNAVYRIYGEFEVAASKPIKGYIQIVKILVFIVGGIIIISTFVGQSPLTILAGLGAVSAVLILIFKDSILGFVAGVQLSSNKMVHIGDWITFAKYNTDGIVVDISLVTVKVRNWDNSVSLIPTYFMVSDSFLNWRSMAEGGGRRLRRSFHIDIRTVKEAGQDILEKTNDLIQTDKLPINLARKITNLGLFRYYLLDYLRKVPEINTEMSILVKLLQATDVGLPVEIIAYTRFPDYPAFESFQSALFEHIYSVMYLFELAPYQRP